VSAAEVPVATAEASAARYEIVEFAALRGRAADVRAIAISHDVTLPEMGRATVAGDTITLCVRPNRWLLLSNSSGTGSPAARRLRASFSESEAEEALNRRAAGVDWRSSCEGVAVAVDLSSALTPFRIKNDATYSKLAGGCRIDLDPQKFTEGHAAATLIAQVQVILARLPNELLVLTPSTTARHFKEWLGAPAP
jgi:sarcosine oxidase gamma subunit